MVNNHTCYVYRITNINTRKHYYGSRVTHNKFSNNLLEDLKIYKSSSTDMEFIKDQVNNTEYFKYKIVRTFSEKAEAISFESKLHKKFNVSVNPNFYNMANQTITRFDMQLQVQCEHCLQYMSIGNHSRWHDGRCFMLRTDKDFEWKISKYPYMRHMVNSITGNIEWVNINFFNFDKYLYTDKNHGVSRCIVDGKINIVSKLHAANFKHINNKEYVMENSIANTT